MKRTKKFASLLLALVMVLSMSMTAFAAQEGELTGGIITINDAVPGETYNAYQILYLESYNTTTNAYAYKANSAWEEWLKNNNDAKRYLSVDDQGYVTWKENADPAAFAALLKGQLTGKAPAATAKAPAAAKEETYSIVTLPSGEDQSLKLGYYLVDTTLGTLCSLGTTKPDVTIAEKNVEPTIEKKITKGGSVSDESTAKIGDTVSFKTTIHAKKGARNYVLHDKMETGLTLDANSIVVSIANVAATKDTDYTVNTSTTNTTCGHTHTVADKEETYNCTFTIAFAQAYLDKISADTAIEVTYSATLNEGAEVADGTNDNTAMLAYGDSSHTTWDNTTTKTFKFDIVKTDSSNKLLNGAQFELYDSKTGGTKIPLVYDDGVYRVATTGGSTVIEATGGRATVQGLDSKTYWLEETVAPGGYNKLSARTEVKIENANLTTTMEGDTWAEGKGGVHITNQSGSELPSTGGMGTRIFYVVGSILVLGAAILLITKRRMNAEK